MNLGLPLSNMEAPIRMGALIRMRALNGVGALINTNTFEGERIFESGR